MDVGSPILDVVPGPRGAVLAALARLDVPVTGRRIARASGQAQTSTARVLDDLVDAGLVRRTVLGRDHTYELNHRHIAAEAIVALARLRGTLVERLTNLLSSHPGVRGAWLFGSAARGDGDRRSDIDILLVHVPADPPDADDLASWLAVECEAWTGNPVQVVEHSPDTFSQLVGDRNPLIASIGRDGIALTPTSRALIAVATA